MDSSESDATERLRLAAEVSGVGIWEVEAATGTTHWDHRTRELLGVAPEQEISQELFDAILHPDDRDRVQAIIKQAYRPEVGAYEAEYRVVHPGGLIRWVRARGRVKFDEDNRPVRFLGTIHDVTADKEALAERERLAEEARTANRAKDDFLAMLGHELRNPLAPILLALELLRERGQADAELATIERHAQHLRRLVDDLLDIARIRRGKIRLQPADLELSALLKGAVESVTPILQETGQRLTVEAPSDSVTVRLDEARMTQVLANLLRNASKFSEPQSEIVLRVTATGVALTFEVIDRGAGMSTDDLEDLFEPFQQKAQTVERSGGGLGLGLAVVKSLVELHKGQVTVTSDGLGQGATFTVQVPRFSKQGPVTSDLEANGARCVARVLLIEDSQDLRELLAQGLSRRGHVVDEARDGKDGMDRVGTFEPDIVFCDLGLPVIDGFEVARRIRREFGAELPLIALTGYGHGSDRQRALDAGFNDHLTKPVSLSKLQASIERWVAGAENDSTYCPS